MNLNVRCAVRPNAEQREARLGFARLHSSAHAWAHDSATEMTVEVISSSGERIAVTASVAGCKPAAKPRRSRLMTPCIGRVTCPMKTSLAMRPVFHYREGTATHPGRRERHHRHVAQHPPRTRPCASSHPRHHQRPEDDPDCPGTGRTPAVPRLHPHYRGLSPDAPRPSNLAL